MMPANKENQISYRSYCSLGGCLNSDLSAVPRSNGSHHYFTYHYIGIGQASWKQDKPKGPSVDTDRDSSNQNGAI